MSNRRRRNRRSASADDEEGGESAPRFVSGVPVHLYAPLTVATPLTVWRRAEALCQWMLSAAVIAGQFKEEGKDVPPFSLHFVALDESVLDAQHRCYRYQPRYAAASPDSTASDDESGAHAPGVATDDAPAVSSICFPDAMDRWALLMAALQALRNAAAAGAGISKRDIYYISPALFGDQRRSDAALSVLQAVLHAPRNVLGVGAAARAKAVGDVAVEQWERVVSVSRPRRTDPGPVPQDGREAAGSGEVGEDGSADTQWSAWEAGFIAGPAPAAARTACPVFPQDPQPELQDQRSVCVGSLSFAAQATLPNFAPAFYGVDSPMMRVLEQRVRFQAGARWVLVVEKDTVFQQLAHDEAEEEDEGGEACRTSFVSRLRCLLVTGRGYPGVAVRQFLREAQLAGLPLFILADGDPHGLAICAAYAMGTPNQALDCPFPLDIRPLGVFLKDVWRARGGPLEDTSVATRRQLCIPQTAADEAKLRDLEWLLRTGRSYASQKAGLEAGAPVVDSPTAPATWGRGCARLLREIRYQRLRRRKCEIEAVGALGAGELGRYVESRAERYVRQLRRGLAPARPRAPDEEAFAAAAGDPGEDEDSSEWDDD